MQRIIELTEDGSATLFVPQLNEHYHSVKGARTESQHIFIDMGLKASAAPHPHIWEVGFGTGLNALLTLEEAEREKRPIHYTGFELYPLAWEEVDALKYSDNPLFKALHLAPWEVDVAITPYFTLRKVRKDLVNEELKMKHEELSCAIRLNVPSSSPALHPSSNPDVVYFDAFAPEKQPEMWSERIFRNLYEEMNDGGILTTYCAKGAIRRLLQAMGFTVERLPGPPGGKREILRATKKGGNQATT
ncbi:MAG: tRNA (5-methylaminomethyl-2-thiouridine)(34)-methyltransferase MnmD [Bacteroides sp.]|nr:tRNA (5-methylaminomethyl-2-thiouridine)(34)-methyltransferase MnmD [Bacteroides sp.]